MDAEEKKAFDEAAREPTESEIFAKEVEGKVSVRDIFGGDDEFFEQMEGSNGITAVTQASHAAGKAASKFFTATNIILIINILVITGILVYLVTKPPITAIQAQPANDPGLAQVGTEAEMAAKASGQPGLLLDEKTAESLDEASSLQLAERLFIKKQYAKAYYIFNKLSKNLTTHIPSDEFLKDYLQLKMALCLQKTGQHENLSELFTTALGSRSPVVRILTNYYLTFIEIDNKQYLSARMRAYRTIALLKLFEDSFSPTLEADSYFIIAEALTRLVLALNNAPETLPGKLWSDTLRIESVPEMTQNQLRTFLQTGVYQLSEGALVPQIENNPHLNIGSQWSAICLNSPLEELLSRFASASDLNIIWQNAMNTDYQKSVTVYLPTASKQLIAEVASGSTGLISRFHDETILIHNPNIYNNLDEHKDLLTKEAISIWRRFPLRYRGDHRTPNAHYALALLLEYTDETIAALGEYRLVASRYSHNPLAPYALLNSSKLKTNMHDYYGASEDLTELIIQYPDTKVVDQASLYLAETTMKRGVYKDAVNMFRKVYNIDLNSESKRNAAYGLGQCYYETKQYQDAQKWLTHAIRLTENTSDHRLRNAYFMLGKANIELGSYEQASLALRNALGTKTPKEEYVQIILKLVDAEVKQEKYLVALNILENVPLVQLSLKNACKVLLTKSRILRDLDLADTAVSLLRRKIEFIADSRLRAELTLELANAYADVGDLRVARKELTDIIQDLPQGKLSHQANLMLIDIAIKLGDYKEAKYICLQFLSHIDNTEKRNEASNYLGLIYTKLNQHDKAALAYAGIYETKGVALR